MSKFKTIKGKAKLQEYTDWVAIWANETCWNGNYWMCNQFLEFKEALKELAAEEGSNITTEIADLLPSKSEALKISVLTKDLKKFHPISLLLQKCDGVVNQVDVHSLFDKLISDFGNDFKLYISPEAEIVNNKFFESGIVKVLRDELNLSEEENQALKALELPFIDLLPEQKNDEGDDNEEGNYGLDILNDGRKRCRMSTKYIDLRKIPITSNVVERFFSQVKLNMTNM